jgi:hypothetical protein
MACEIVMVWHLLAKLRRQSLIFSIPRWYVSFTKAKFWWFLYEIRLYLILDFGEILFPVSWIQFTSSHPKLRKFHSGKPLSRVSSSPKSSSISHILKYFPPGRAYWDQSTQTLVQLFYYIIIILSDKCNFRLPVRSLVVITSSPPHMVHTRDGVAAVTGDGCQMKYGLCTIWGVIIACVIDCKPRTLNLSDRFLYLNQV